MGTAGCQTMADLDPTGLIGGDDTTTADTQFPPDSSQQAAADANTTTPDLSSIPPRPAQPDATAQAATTQQVATAGSQAQYSADALRAGTDAAAPPPVASDAAATKQALASANAPPTASPDAPPTAGSADQAAPPVASAPGNPNAAVPGGTQVASAAPPPARSTQAASPSAAPVASAPLAPPPGASATTAALAPPPPSGGEPAVPGGPGAPMQMAMVNPSDAQLGFRPSSAPPLSPSVAQWVAPPVLTSYRETASLAGSAGTAMPAVAAVPVTGRRGARGMGGPSMSGDVVANLDAVPGSPLGRAAAMNGGIAPAEIIYFRGDSTRLPAGARNQVRDAVAAFRATGGAGSLKVVGHASSRTGNMTVERHMEVIFQKSQERANAVAQALIRAGIPADRVQIEAVGDSQPIYYESMPKGEDGNRRAEIYVQG
jgi:outer membrane protein OmpA-like peptidoglycan-associated protein